MKTDDNRCRKCGTKLIGKNAIDVGYCIPCYHMMMADDEEDDIQIEIRKDLNHQHQQSHDSATNTYEIKSL